nr:hypothetical protein [uncultured Roseococcus sp.]
MSPRRPHRDADRSLKVLTRALVQRVGGFEAAASCVRVGISRLHDYTDPKTDSFAPVDVIAALEEMADEPLVTAEMARRAQQILVPLDVQGQGEIAEAMAKLGKEIGEGFAAYAEAMMDGELERPEMERMARELSDVVGVASSAVGILQRKIGQA